ncbi:MAG TPA: hypothetical protein VE398_19830 [Acidobacteriota bacterium]|nr:hypothetical protein [Acidobacteriota bacterium]
MNKSAVLWILAFVTTLASAYYQRRTGPTYPIRGHAIISEKEISYQLLRSHGGGTDCPVQIITGHPAISGIVEWKHHGTDERYAQAPMTLTEGVLMAELPHQPPAGTLEYRVILKAGSDRLILPEEEPAVVRFKGDTPAIILIPHIIAMFAAMLFSTRAGLEIFSPNPRLETLTYCTIAFLVAGGMILGPIMQKYAFGAYWTGWPLGTDLTDNKTAVALLGWVAAAVALKRAKRPAIWAAIAALLLMTVYMIPHSVLGSELKPGAGQPQPCAAMEIRHEGATSSWRQIGQLQPLHRGRV